MIGSPKLLQLLEGASRAAGALPNRVSAGARHRMELADQWKAVRIAEQHNHKLDAAMLAKCRDYSIATFGTDSHAAFLALCASVHGAWRDGLIPELYFWRFVGPRRYGAWHAISRAKTLTPRLFSGPFSPDLATLFNGRVYRPDMSLLPSEDVKPYLFAGRDRIIFKSDGIGYGTGIRFFSADSFDPAELAGLGSGVIQSIIEPHPELSIPGVEALTTIRIGTVVDATGQIRPRYVTLRLGRRGRSHIVHDHSVRLDIDPQSGEWADTGYLVNWTPLKEHPDAPVRFAGRVIPDLPSAVALCLQLHAKIPFLPSVGWDVCLNRQGQYELMEWNVPHGISFAEPMNGPIFAGLGFEQLWKQDGPQ